MTNRHLTIKELTGLLAAVSQDGAALPRLACCLRFHAHPGTSVWQVVSNGYDSCYLKRSKDSNSPMCKNYSTSPQKKTLLKTLMSELQQQYQAVIQHLARLTNGIGIEGLLGAIITVKPSSRSDRPTSAVGS